jgi:hypothetical protein
MQFRYRGIEYHVESSQVETQTRAIARYRNTPYAVQMPKAVPLRSRFVLGRYAQRHDP